MHVAVDVMSCSFITYIKWLNNKFIESELYKS